MNRSAIRRYYITKCKIAKESGDVKEICYQRCHQRVRGVKFIGTKEEFVNRFEELFKGTEYSWNNYGKWEIDHIIPLSAGGQHEVSNLQPLWKEINQRKQRANYSNF